ncbi:MAG TPA: hypothetical protein VK689_14845, partial [Armatimonadota bacterium]|nr:hypothetical protein [Armatimonadota bacterium]
SVFVYSGRDGSLLRRLNGPSEGFALGTALACCKLDRDRLPEIIVGAARVAPEADFRKGAVLVFSGRDGSLLQRIDGEVVGSNFGFAVACCERRGKGTGTLVGAPLDDPEGREDAGTVSVLALRRRGRR